VVVVNEPPAKVAFLAMMTGSSRRRDSTPTPTKLKTPSAAAMVRCAAVASENANGSSSAIAAPQGPLPQHWYILWWITWRATVHHAVDDVAITGTLCGG